MPRIFTNIYFFWFDVDLSLFQNLKIKDKNKYILQMATQRLRWRYQFFVNLNLQIEGS